MKPIKKNTIFAVSLLSLIVAAPLHLLSQAGMENIQFNHLTVEDGLSQSTVETILQDSHGYMWFGTYNGLNKYNGYDITVYKFNSHNPNSIIDNEIAAIVEDENDNLWIATFHGGLNRYNREQDNFTRFTSDFSKPANQRLPVNSLYSMALDHDGGLWIGTPDGLIHMDLETEEFTHYTADPENPESLSNNSIRSLLTDQNGNLWIGTEKGLNVLYKGKENFTRYLYNHIQALHEDSNGNIWIGTNSSGLKSFDRKNETFSTFLHDADNPESISDNSIRAIFEDSFGSLWVGTDNQGLNLFDRDQGTFNQFRDDFHDPSNLNSNAIYSIYESNDNLLWVGTFNGGLNITHRKPSMFEHYRHDPNIPHTLSTNSVFSFLEDSAGNFWVGTDGGGLNLFDRSTGNFKAHKHNPHDPKSLSSNVIFDIEQDKDGYLWLGTYRGGVNRFDINKNTSQVFKHEPDNSNSLSTNEVFALHFDKENPDYLWIGTNGGGINRMNITDKEFATYRILENRDDLSISNNYIREFYEDSYGNIWIGSYGGNFISFNKQSKKYTSYDITHDEFKNNAVQSILEDAQNRLWLGTRGGGLLLFDRNTKLSVAYTESHGLSSNNVYGILEDDTGYLWLSTDSGLSRFNPEAESFITYGVEHGLQNREFNQRAFYKDSEGYMYFGGINGFNRFHPDNITLNEDVSPVVFTDFQIFNDSVPIAEDSPLKKHISLTEEITLPYDATVLTINYAALNYEFHKGYQFAYKMEGFDQEWRNVNDIRSATYTNLNPGSYTFRVKAANSDGIWSEEDTSLSIIITPPFWATTWFYMLSGLLITGLIWGGYQYRVRKISQHNKNLEKEVKAQTSKLSEQNKELNKTLEELNETKGQLVEKAHKAGMADVATGVLHNVGNILNSVNVSASHMKRIINGSQLKNIQKANALLRENRENIDQFIQSDPKGKKLIDYYLKLENPIVEEHKQLLAQNQRLIEKINLIIDVVAAQQSYSMAGRVVESLSLQQIIDDTIALQDASFHHHKLNISKDYQTIVNVDIEKTKLVHVLINLLKNAKESIAEQNSENKTITIKTWQDNDNAYLSITDTGIGIQGDQLTKIFNHGYTTKDTGHGYGLHSCANYMKEMGGLISVDSKGAGKGATFTLTFPRINKKENNKSGSYSNSTTNGHTKAAQRM